MVALLRKSDIHVPSKLISKLVSNDNGLKLKRRS